jgi:hypothetical protein
MKEIYLLMHISYDYYPFQEVYAASDDKNKLYEQAKKNNNNLPIYEFHSPDNAWKNEITHFLITELKLL